ncbi:MAG TPA: hypothetical protein VJ256_04725 [Dehalococcoidia bacterium]|nr:hypothetical protein [Dehalococcoidia bacterium]
MDGVNRAAIVILAALVIIAAAVVSFVAWAAADEAIGRLQDFVQYLAEHNDNPGRLILTLGALTLVVLAILVIVVELAPMEEVGQLRVEQAGATTIVAVPALRQRLEEVLLALPSITAAKVSIDSRNKGIVAALDLTVTAQTNVAEASQEAVGAVTRALSQEMGLPLAEAPRLRITFGAPRERAPAAPSSGPTLDEGEPAAERSEAKPEGLSGGSQP